MRYFCLLEAFIMTLCMAGNCFEVKPSEMYEQRAWVAAAFEDTLELPGVQAGIEVIENHDPLQVNIRNGKLMCIKGEHFDKGLYTHAPSHLKITLPEPATSFEALCGVDSNEQTMPGHGSVVASVWTGDAELWKSELMREGMPALAVKVDLQGKSELSLKVNDGGDGIACDQFSWANAKVTLQSGKTLWLGDLPVFGTWHEPSPSIIPFSFNLDNHLSRHFLRSWKKESSVLKLDDQRDKRTVLFRADDAPLEVRWEAIEYRDYPVVEWTVYIKNIGNVDSPMLSNIQAIDTTLFRNQPGEYALRYHTGDLCTADSFEPHREELKAGTTKRIANTGGRPTQTSFPYFNLETPQGGWIFALSWAGQWAVQYERDADVGLRIIGGQETTNLLLHPGEEIRTPMVVLLFWKGDWLRAQNMWRRWMVDHNLPRPGGSLPPVPHLAACSSHQYGEMINADSKSQMFFVDRYLEEKIMLNYWWMDAGWYFNKTGWPNTGTWEVDTNRFPGGLRPITDHAHSKGVKSIVWFEPERVTPGTWLYDSHPEWLLGKDGEQKLLNLGNDEARAWLINHVDKLLTEQGIDLYRQDFNMDPLPHWQPNDAPNRVGMTEIKHVMGYFAYWDELRRRHPNMLIDSCASGGRRNDLETLRRAVPLLRSDYIMEPVGNQCHTYALSFWYPFYGTGTSRTDTYQVRSVLCPHFIACWDMRDKSLDYDNLRHIMDTWKEYAPCFMGDYYPITNYTLANDQWIAWQFHLEDKDEGMAQVFRRADSIYESARLPLKAVRPEAKYLVWNVDDPKEVEMTGAELIEKGIPVSISERPAALIYRYRRAE